MPAYVSPDNIQWTPLQSQTFAAGASVSVQTAGAIPTGRQVRRVIFRLDIDTTQTATGIAELGLAYHQLIAQIKIGRRISITGLGLKYLNWMTRGMEPQTPAGFALSANGVMSRSVVWSLDYHDVTAEKPGDYSVPSELWTDPIEVRFGTNAVFPATQQPALGNGLLRIYVEHEAASVAKNGKRLTVPPSLNIQSDDFNALTAMINKPGAWVYALAYRETLPYGSVITSANVSNLIVNVDGVPLMNNCRAQDVATFFNQVRAAAPVYEQEGQSDPVPDTSSVATAAAHYAGSMVNDQPGTAAAAGQAVNLNFVPLLFPALNYRISQVPRAKIGFRLDLTGTLGSYKIAYRIIERRPDNGIGNAARRLGISNGVYGAKVAHSSIKDDPELAPFLPASVREK